MEIQTVDEKGLGNLFPELGEQQQNFGFNAGGGTADMFSPPETPEEPATPEVAEPETPEVPETPETPETPESDILTDTPPAKSTISDVKSYYENRIKSGKFINIEEEDEAGNKKSFIPQNDDELDEVLDMQIKYRADEIIKQRGDSWYKEKSPAWQMVAKYAEMTDNPEDIFDFIQPMRNFNSVAELDPENLEHAEQIVKTKLMQTGDDEELVNETIESLKTTDKLKNTAIRYKPMILEGEKRRMAEMVNQKQEETDNYLQLINDVRDNAIKAIETPLFGKSKLKQEEMASVYDLIGEPSKETRGYLIYSEIDSLFEKGDFETLKEVALMLKHKDSYQAYLKNQAKQENSEGLQRKLRLSAESSTSTNNDDPNRVVVNRTKYTGSGKFGR